MSRAEQQESRSSYLLRNLCDDRLTDDEAVELAELLATSDSVRRRYVEMMQVCVELANWSEASGPISIPHPAAAKRVDMAAALADTNKKATSKDAVKRQRRTAGAESVSARRFGWIPPWLAWGAAAAMLVAVSLFGWNYFGNGKAAGPVVAASSAEKSSSEIAVQAESQKSSRPEKFVAHVVEITDDARWDNELRPREFLMRLREGEKLHLLSGLAQLEFYSGARIILQGPSEFTPTGPTGGRLESGRLTGKVEGGKFHLITPTAKVIDLGTEFGVTVGPKSDTDVCVFVGEVEVQPGSDHHENHDTDAEAYNLTQGMSVRVEATGKVSDGMDAGVDYDVYNRSFPSQAKLNPDELDLVDIICGGNGQGMRLAAAIDPLTGQLDRRPWNNPLSPGTRKGDGLFHLAVWHPFIDGTFVPNKRGEPMQADSRRGTITLPKEGGDYTWGPIWARRAVTDATQFDRSADSWGAKTFPVITERLTRCRLGGIGIHASVGITFDLKAIGKELKGSINELKATLANLENSKEHNPEWARANPAPAADFRVFVDGQLRYEKLKFARNVEGEVFEVPLSSKDRFLTFVTTDAGDSNKYDHIVVIDPVLGIRDAKQTGFSQASSAAKVEFAY